MTLIMIMVVLVVVVKVSKFTLYRSGHTAPAGLSTVLTLIMTMVVVVVIVLTRTTTMIIKKTTATMMMITTMTMMITNNEQSPSYHDVMREACPCGNDRGAHCHACLPPPGRRDMAFSV